MGGKRIKKKVMPESFEKEERTFNQRVVVREIVVIPNEFSGESREHG